GRTTVPRLARRTLSRPRRKGHGNHPVDPRRQGQRPQFLHPDARPGSVGGASAYPVRTGMQAIRPAPGPGRAPTRFVRAAARRSIAPSLIAIAGDFMGAFRRTAVTMLLATISQSPMLRTLAAAALLAATSPLSAH